MVLLFTIILLSLCIAFNADEVPRLPGNVLYNSYTGQPVCAFFKHAGTPPEFEDMSRFMKTNFAETLADWTIGSVKLEDITQISPLPHLYPSMVPSIQCDVGLPLPLEFTFTNKNQDSLKKWFKSVAKKHVKHINIANLSTLKDAILYNSEGIIIVSVPGLEYFQHMAELMLQVREKGFSQPLEILISRPETEGDRKIQTLFHIHKYPTVLFFTHEVWVERKTFAHMLQGLQQVQPQSIEVTLRTIDMKANFLDEDRFYNEVLDTKYQLPPKLVCFFSYSNLKSLKYILKFREISKQFECEGASLEFRLMNIGEKNNSRVFNRYINASNMKTFPVFVLFWQELTPTYGISNRQKVMDGIPLVSELYSFLRQNGILDESDNYNNGECVSEEDDHSLECANPSHSHGICATDSTTMNASSLDVYSSLPFIVKGGKEKKRKLWNPRNFVERVKIGNLTVLTDHDWSTVLEASLYAPTTKKLFVEDAALPVLNLVVFMIKDCRYCKIVMQSLEKLAEAIHLIDRAALYLVNCSSSPIICNRYQIQGYPSMKLFRSMPWSGVEGCVTDQLYKQHVILDFHGPFEPHHFILEWLSHSTLPIVNKEFLLTDFPEKLDNDVWLVGTVVTLSQAFRFLQPSTYNKWYSVKCFQTACELLFGKAVCFATMTKDFGVNTKMKTTKNKDLFVIKLTLFRRDGVQAKIFELGVPLQTTLLSEKDSKLHKFHNAHRYNLPRKLRCEDNHSLCTEFTVKYVIDHSRLPVTRLTHDGFHTLNRFSYGGDNSSSSVPVVVVLAHKQNLTINSSYYQKITQAAYELYREIIFTALDVDEYPSWASRFVPKDYESTQSFQSANGTLTPPLYHYPRMCVVMSTDHNQAAFFPSLKATADAKNIAELLYTVTTKEIVKFLKQYLLHPKDLLVTTEVF